jgi:RNA polymerase subunit RPABC4/transcription elongation factor Spt4
MPFMDSISKLAKSVGDGAKTAVKKSEDMLEISKLNRNIANEEDRIKLAYNEIGKLVFNKFEKGNESDPELLDICNKIVEIQKGIAAIKQKIVEIKNEKLCQNCGSEMDANEEFCTKCGSKQESMDTPEREENIIEESNTLNTCPQCGAAVTDDLKFCSNCGTKLK